MTISRRGHLFIAFAFFVAGIILNYTYRSYIYNNNIDDRHLADTIGSWVAIPAWVNFLMWQRSPKTRSYSLGKWCVISVLLGYCWEIAGALGIHGTFDWYDIIAYTLSGGITYLAMRSFVVGRFLK